MARAGLPAWALASACAIFNRPSKKRTFCSCSRVAPRATPVPAAGYAARSRGPTLEKRGERAIHVVCGAYGCAGKLEGVRRGARLVAPHQCEHGREHTSGRECADMRDVRDPRLGGVDERKLPHGLRRKAMTPSPGGPRPANVGVGCEPKGQIVVAARLEQGERAFQMIRASRYSPANQHVIPKVRWATSSANWVLPRRRGERRTHASSSRAAPPARSCRPTSHSPPPIVRTHPRSRTTTCAL